MSDGRKKRTRIGDRMGRTSGMGRPTTAFQGSDLSEALERVPAWLPPITFAALTAFLFREFIFSDRMLYGEDTLSLGYMARAFYAEALRTTGFPLWNPVILGGTPFLESLAGGDSLYPPSLLLLVLMDTYRALGWKLVLHVFLAGWFMYIWLRSLDVSHGSALVGGIAYLLAPYMVTLVLPGHDGKLFVTALTPLLFWACEWTFRRRDLLPFAVVGGVVALVLLTTHFQMAYFLFGAVGSYMVFRSIQVARKGGWDPGQAARHFATFLGFSVLGAGAAGVQLLPAVEYVTEHSRRTATTVAADPAAALEYSSSWSLHPEEWVSLVVPEFVGNTRADADWGTDTYWGRNPFKLNHEYLGLGALLLALLAFLGPSHVGLRRFLFGMGGLAALFALGAHTPVWRLFYELLPGVSLFRAPSMIIFLTGFSVATLAGIGLDGGAREIARGHGSRLLLTLGVATLILALGLLLALTGVLNALWGALFAPELSAPRQEALIRAYPFMVRGFVLATGLAGLLLAVWWGLVKGVMNAPVALGLIALLVSVDELRVSDPFVRTLDYASFVSPDPNQQFLMERVASEPPFRVFSMIQAGQDVAPGMHGIDLAAGHHPNDLQRYRELIGMEGSGVPEHLALFHPNVMRLLNIHYVLWPDAQFGPLEGVDPISQVAFLDGTIYASVYPYPALPRARVVGEVLVLPEEEVLDAILGNHPMEYDPDIQTILTVPPPIEPGGSLVRGSARWIERSPNRLILDVESSGPGLLVLSENWFPGWEATVDGVPTTVLRSDHTLRAVPVDAGTQRVELRFRPPAVRAGLMISLASLLALGGLGVSGPLRRRLAGRSKGVDGEE